jgi:hypothetical protein
MKDINICKTNYSRYFQDLDMTLKIQSLNLFLCIVIN